MSTVDKYVKIKEAYPPMVRCFFAFSDKQFGEGKIKSGILPDEKKIEKSTKKLPRNNE